MKLYLHIGAGKCGSTAIQCCLFQNRKLFLQKGIYIPEKGMKYPQSHHGSYFENRESFLELLEELRIAKKTYSSAVVSWEGLVKIQDDALKSDFAELREFDSEVIFYVREQAEHIQKGLLQRFKKDPEVFKTLKVLRKNRDFFALAEKWSNYVGKLTNVILFDRETFPNRDVVEDFLKRIGIIEYSEFKWGHIKVNESLFIDSAKILDMTYRGSETKKRMRSDMLDALLAAQNFVKGNSYYLTQIQVAEIRSKYMESNMNLKKKYGLDLSVSYSDCWVPENVFDIINEELLEKFNELQSVPLLRPDARSNKLSQYLLSGWRKCNGEWWSQQHSVIRFRLKLQRQSRIIDSINIELVGTYCENIEASTHLMLGGKDLENYNLQNAVICIPINDISRDGVVNFELIHQHSANEEVDDKYFSISQINISILSVDGTIHVQNEYE